MLTFNDPRIIQRLRTEFIPVSANTQDLQWRGSPAQQFYLGLVARTQGAPVKLGRQTFAPGNAAGTWPGKDTLRRQMSSSLDPQGMYILGPDGSTYGFTNDHEPADILRFMDRALRGYAARPPRPAVVSDADVATPWSYTPPPGATVVRVFSRIRPLPQKVWGLNRGVGRDFLWIYPEDVQALIDASAAPTFLLPEALVTRLVRFHLVDGVRGTPDLWAPYEVKRAAFTGKTLRQTGTVRTLSFVGDFSMRGGRNSAAPETAGQRVEQGHVGRIEGEVDIDLKTQALLRFRAYSDGQAWGEGTFTPYPPPGRFRLLSALVEASPADQAARVVPPEAVATGRGDEEYRRPAKLPIAQGLARGR